MRRKEIFTYSFNYFCCLVSGTVNVSFLVNLFKYPLHNSLPSLWFIFLKRQSSQIIIVWRWFVLYAWVSTCTLIYTLSGWTGSLRIWTKGWKKMIKWLSEIYYFVHGLFFNCMVFLKGHYHRMVFDQFTSSILMKMKNKDFQFYLF